jgi:cystathionine beta-lyase/cystathionine gamma-synthase
MSEGSLKPPVFLTSTFVFENAQQGKDFFDLTAGRRQLKPGEKSGLVYSRFNHPNMEILEDRLAIWDEAEKCAVFASGMAAIATTCFAFLRPRRHHHPQPPALWRHRDAAEEPDGRLRRHALRLHRRHRHRADAGGRARRPPPRAGSR